MTAARLKTAVRLSALALGASLLLTLTTEGFARESALDALIWAAQSPLMLLMNAALWLGLCMLLFAFKGWRARGIGFLALSWFCAVYGLANDYKLRYRMEPVLYTDLMQLGDAMEAVTGLSLDVNMALLAGLCAFFALAILLCALRVRGRDRRRVLPAIAGVLVLALSARLCTFENAGSAGLYDMVAHARAEGVLYAAVAVENQRNAAMPEGYGEEAVREAYAAMRDAAPETAASDGPNVVLVLCESYVSGNWLEQYVSLTRELTPFFDSLAATCQSGSLYVPKLGGGTSETEFEVLTGVRSRYGANPYAVGLPAMNSLAYVLSAKGYEATALHWYYGVYYDRYNNLRNLGFDSFHTLDTTDRDFEHVGMFVSDAEHYASILKQMERSEGRDFVFCLTMQNHGGYAYDDFRLTYGADTPFTDSLSEQSEKVVANYCYLLEQSDQALQAFVAELEAFEEPTVLVLFGDHIPPLGAEVYEELGIAVTGDEGHLTPYLIWSNVHNEPDTVNLYAYELGASALKAAGLLDDPFLAYVESLRAQSSGDALTGAGHGDSAYDLLCYDALYGEQYAYALSGLALENDNFQIGGEMTLTGFDAASVADAVYLRPRLAIENQAYKLEINGAVTDNHFVLMDGDPLSLACVLPGRGGASYNRSATLFYESAEALLTQSGALGYEAVRLEERSFRLEKSARGYALYVSEEPLVSSGITALTLDGERMEWQPVYGLNRAGQYGVDEGCLYVALPAGVEDAAAYFREHQATLYVFER